MLEKILAWFKGAKEENIDEVLSANPVSRFAGVVVGEILEINPHPNADRLRLTKVSVGKQVLHIVCGADNIAVGQKVPTAMIGCKLPNGLEIKPAKIRGEESQGMLCAADELGLGEDHSGILLLDTTAKAGAEIDNYLPQRQ